MTHFPSSRTITPSSLSSSIFYLIGLISLISCLPQVSAFGSGNIPSAAYLKGKAWRHGDIEDTLEGLVKVAGQGGGGAIVGAIASALLGSASGSIGRGFKGGKKFTGLDVKRIYFGNWLRDLSQVCDIAGFKAMTPESLVICIMTMGFLSFGYATREFQVTRERLSVYLLTEHIDNPKGYAEGEDPRKYDPRLRPSVDEARELRIDDRNGMKMYIASEDQGFDTSTACIRRVFRSCIELGRQAQREGNQEKEFESFRLLGTGLHTLEDFSAHSNWCELALQKLGHKEVFAHVGENVKVNSPEGLVPPLVTGTFAGADFCFSMLGEASDKLSSASISDLTAQLDTAQTANNKPGGINLDFIKSIMSKLPLGGNDSAAQQDLDSMDEKKHAFDLDGRIDQVAPEELQAKIWELFKVRDNLMRRIEETIQGIPGLGEMLENLSLSLAQWVMVTIDPYVRPILLQASSAIGKSSQAVISGNDQWTVFNDPNASDPTHSVLAKDHFSNILNDPAGNISVIIVKYTVGLMVEAWSNDANPDSVIDQILEAIHHPNFASRNSKIQREMLEYMQKWLNEMERDERELTIRSLTKDSIRNHRNQRKTSKSGDDPRLSGGAPSHGYSHPAYQQSSMHEGSYSGGQHGRTSQNASADYPRNQYADAPPKSKHSDSQPQSKHGGYHSQGQYTAGSEYDTATQHGNIRNAANQGGYANAGKNSTTSGRLNQSNLEDEYRNNSEDRSHEYGRSASHSQNTGSFGKNTDGGYKSVAERRDQYSSTYDHQPEKTSHSRPYGSPGREYHSHDADQEKNDVYKSPAERRDQYSSAYDRQSDPSSHSQAYGSLQGREHYSHSTETEKGGAYRSTADGRNDYSSTYDYQPEKNSGSQPYDSATGHHNFPNSGHGHQSQNKNSYASLSSHSTHSSARTGDYEQLHSRDNYNQSEPSFPEVHAGSLESSYGGRVGLNTSDLPSSEYSSRYGSTQGGHQQSSRPAFPEVDHGSSQSTHGRHNVSNADAYRNGPDSELNDYNPNPIFPQAQYSGGGSSHRHDSHRDHESSHENRYADTGSTRNTQYSKGYGDSARVQGYGEEMDREREHQDNSDYGMDRLNMQDAYSRRY